MDDADIAPIFLKLRDELAEKIVTGRLRSGDRLPSERVLAAESGAARMTVREALRILEGDGLIYRKDRRGYFVCPPRLRYDPTHHVNAMRLIPSQQHKVGGINLGGEIVPATPSLAKSMGCRKGIQVFQQRGIALMDDRRVCYEESYLLKNAFPGFLQKEHDVPLTDFLAREYGFGSLQVGFSARSMTLYGAAADNLEVRRGTPGFFITRIKANEPDGRILQVDREYWLGTVLEIVVGAAP